MVSQKTVLTALLYFSVFVFVSIWFMTRNFPEKVCDCSKCFKKTHQQLEQQFKSKRDIEDNDTVQGYLATTPKLIPITTNIPLSTEKELTPREPEVKLKTLAVTEKPRHKLGVIIPFRERLEELLEFVPYMSTFLFDQNITFHIYVINQVDTNRFNRAALINAGFLIATQDSCDYIAMHDVDLLPMNKDLNYGYPEEGPFHVSAPNLHPKYHYEKFIGGIMLINNEHFKKVNGLSTLFWGWGREDDELYMRIQEAKLTIQRPVGITTGYQTFQHNHPKKRRRDYPTSRKQFKESFKRDRITGLNTMNHKVLSRYEMTIQNYPLSMVSIELTCNKTVTPWC